MIDEGFYVIKNGIQYKLIENKNINWHKCDTCAFSINNKCIADINIKKVCELLDGYWAITVSNIDNNNNNNIFTFMHINDLNKLTITERNSYEQGI